MNWTIAYLTRMKALCRMESASQPHTVDREQIYNHMENYGDHKDVFKSFMPSSSIDELTTKKKVLSTLQSEFKGKELKKLVSFVRENDARRIFLCLTLIDGLQYLPEFMDIEFTDKDLPVANSTNVRIFGQVFEERLFDDTRSIIERSAKNFPLEGKSRVRDRFRFLEKQWFFLSPNCSEGSLDINVFHPNRPMAYLPPSPSNGPISSSNLSVVWRVYLHPDHFEHHLVG